MNIFEKHLNEIKDLILKNKSALNLNNIENLKSVNLDTPPEQFNYDLSCNIAMILGKSNKLNSKELAQKLKKLFLNKINSFVEVQIAGPGFINIKLSNTALIKNINMILKSNKTYGAYKTKKIYNIEFVSANPTGPMHVGHCRGAVFGDVLSNLLLFNGNKVIKEYYINDYGNQIKNFVESVYLRIREIKYKEKFILKENLYPGEYIKEIANNIIKENKDINVENLNNSFDELKKLSLQGSMTLIKDDLKKLGIQHDNFFSETELVKKDLVNKTIKQLKNKNLVEEGYLDPPKGEKSKNWKKIKRLIFKSTEFGDDTNRALQKDDGSWTYFANDVAYHSDKISRKYDNLINILGADHTGYIKRISAGVSALSDKKVKLNCKVCQLVKLYKNGKPFKMSKRAGDFISVQDLLDEVNKDSIRFMMLNRSNDVELDFDFKKVTEQSKDNPVFYVQYAYARINSIYRNLKLKIDDKIKVNTGNFDLNSHEIEILRKISEWPRCIEISINKMEPHRIPFYLYELVTLFHAYWNMGRDNEQYRFIKNNKATSNWKLLLLQALSIVIRNGMTILGVSVPKKM